MTRTEQDTPARLLQRWISVGDLISLALSLLALGIAFGNLSTRLDSVEDKVDGLADREMTPGAAQAIAAMQASDRAQDLALIQIREDATESRREILARLGRIEEKLDQHMDRRP